MYTSDAEHSMTNWLHQICRPNSTKFRLMLIIIYCIVVVVVVVVSQ